MERFAEERSGGAQYLAAVRARWLLIVSIVAVAVTAAVLLSALAEQRYEAKADVLVTPIEAGDETFIGINLLREGSQSRSVLTAAHLVATPQVAERAKEELNFDGTPEELLKRVDVQPQEQSNILTIVGKATTAEGAAEIANAFAQSLIGLRTETFQDELDSVVERLEARLDAIPESEQASPEAVALSQRLGELGALDGANDPTLQMTSEAIPPADPVWPRPVLSIAVALLAGLLVGIGLAVALELVNPRVKDEDELLLEQRLPILGRVPRMGKKTVRSYLTGKEPLPGDVREAYRTLRANLAVAGPDGTFPDTILVTSAVPGEGKTMTATNLATSLANSGLRVVLADGDLRRPMVGTLFGVPASRANFAGVLFGTVRVEDALVPVPAFGDRLRLLPAHHEHGGLPDLLQADRVAHVLAELRLYADVVVIDSAPITQVADALILADAVDAVLVAVRLGHTPREELGRTRAMLAQRGITPAGFVVTMRRRSRGKGYSYGAQEAQAEPASQRGLAKAASGDQA